MHLLHLDASARQADSLSRLLGREVVDAWRRRVPDAVYTHRDFALQPVPHITEAWTEICDPVMREGIPELDRLHEAARTPGQRAAWAVVEPLLDELVAADVVLVATPMYNYGVPSALKAWIDQVTFPRVDLAPRRFAVVAARGGDYAPGAPKAAFEHQLTYLGDFFSGHFGVARPLTLAVDLGNARVDPLLASRRDAHLASLAAARHGVDGLVAELVREGEAA